ncbi:hypothetical protein ACVWWN_000155 [Mycobacterium sp. URHB0021]
MQHLRQVRRESLKTREIPPCGTAGGAMHAPDRIWIVRTTLRLSLATAFLSAVAERFGWWAPFRQGNWGSMRAFANYAHQLVPICLWMVIDRHRVDCYRHRSPPRRLPPDRLAAETRAAASCLVLMILETAMAVSLGVESPLSYSVFSAASAAAAYAILGTSSPHTTDAGRRCLPGLDNRNRRKPSDGAAAGLTQTQVYVPITESEGR